MTANAPPAPSVGVRIRPMRRRHLPAVLRIEHDAHPRPWTLRLFASELAQDEGRYYVIARAGGRIAGYGGLMFVADEAHITNLAVAPALQRQHLGTRLLVHLARESLRRGCAAMTLEVRMSNTAAQELYRKFGFVSAGVRRNYYSEIGEDALIMWLYELASPEVQARLRSIEDSL